jgi:GntR family transcriptional regulator
VLFRLDRSRVPTYLQLAAQVKQAILLGDLQPGDRLPTVRAVAASLVINPNTVAKGYRELEREGLAVAHPGRGTFITDQLGPIGSAIHRRLSRSLQTWLLSAYAAGLDHERVMALFTATLAAFEERENVA